MPLLLAAVAVRLTQVTCCTETADKSTALVHRLLDLLIETVFNGRVCTVYDDGYYQYTYHKLCWWQLEISAF